MPKWLPLAVWMCCVCAHLCASSDDAPFLSGLGVGREAQTGPYTVSLRDKGYVIDYTGSGIVTMPLPANSAVGNGFTIGYYNSSASNETITANSGDHILMQSGSVTSLVLTQYQGISFVTDGIGNWKGWMYGGIGSNPVGAAGGDLSSTYPNPTVAKINGVTLGSTTASSGNVLIGSGSSWVTQALSGDATIGSTGIVALKATGPGAGSYTNSSITIDAQGRITAASTGSSFAPLVFGNLSSTFNTFTTQFYPATALGAGYYNVLNRAIRIQGYGYITYTGTPTLQIGCTFNGSNANVGGTISLPAGGYGSFSIDSYVQITTAGSSGGYTITGTTQLYTGSSSPTITTMTSNLPLTSSGSSANFVTMNPSPGLVAIYGSSNVLNTCYFYGVTVTQLQ